MRQTLIGVFSRYADAQQAARRLQHSGFGDSVFRTGEAAGERRQQACAGRGAEGDANMADRDGRVVRVEIIGQAHDLDAIREALQRAGAIEVEERSAAASRLTGDTGRRRDFAAYDTAFRHDFEIWYGGLGIPYDDYEPAYRYGHALANDAAYAGRRWEDFEPDARRTWERLHPRRAWHRIRIAVRHAWQQSMW